MGCLPNEGVPGNTSHVNPNGRRFLEFLTLTDSKHINGMQTLTTGLWTRQRGGSSSVIDFAAVSREHMDTVISLYIDDHGDLGGGSDHNWIILDMTDYFIKLRRVSNVPKKKKSWNISDDQNWSGFQEHIRNLAVNISGCTADSLASAVSSAILAALHAEIGLSSSMSKSKPRNLPPELVEELRIKRGLERNWKTLNSSHGNSRSPLVDAAEQWVLRS